jgi:imidazole glycerol-phosphate synthase subunit HisH
MKCVVIDYGLCNLLSVYNALKHLGVNANVSSDPQSLKQADRVILPGVGAFADGMKGLTSRGFEAPIHDFVKTGKPFLGICLGMQFLMDKSYEFGEHTGLGLIPGEVRSLKETLNKQEIDLNVPHIGWNHLNKADVPWDRSVLSGLTPGVEMYFVHSFHAVTKDPRHTLALTPYGLSFSSVVAKDNVYGCQFHPEKSAVMGLHILKNFISL